jgi:hypothetical protein
MAGYTKSNSILHLNILGYLADVLAVYVEVAKLLIEGSDGAVSEGAVADIQHLDVQALIHNYTIYGQARL